MIAEEEVVCGGSGGGGIGEIRGGIDQCGELQVHVVDGGDCDDNVSCG